MEGAKSRAGMVAGVIGAAVALAAMALLHTLVPRVPFPPVDVADAVVRATPGSVAGFFIDRLGHLALPLTVIGTTAGFLVSSSGLGRLLPKLAHHVPGAAIGAAVLLGVPLYATAVLALQPDSQTVGRAVYAVLLLPPFALSAWVTGRRYAALTAAPSARPATASPADPSRRSLLLGLGLATAGLAVGWADPRRLLFPRSDPGRQPLRVRELSPAPLPEVAPGDPSFEGIPDLSPEITSNEAFYVVDKEIIDPDVDANAWTLSVGGLVQRPYELDYDELLDLPATEGFVTLECISNEVGGDLISTARWTGIPVRDLLARAGIRDGTVEVVFRAVGGYSDSITIEQAMVPTTLVAIGMNGQTLPRAHGFPARLLVPGLYGMKQPKWLESIEVVDRPYTGYWEQRGWSKAAVVKTMSRVDTVAQQQDRLVVAGVAFAGDRGVSRVEVSTDGGTGWEGAELKTALSDHTWRLWRYAFEAPGDDSLTILCRATDSRGEVQVQEVTPPRPEGATGYHSITLADG